MLYVENVILILVEIKQRFYCLEIGWDYV